MKAVRVEEEAAESSADRTNGKETPDRAMMHNEAGGRLDERRTRLEIKLYSCRASDAHTTCLKCFVFVT